jgi:hypothetical protein
MIANDTLRLDTDADTRISNGPGVRKIPIVARCQAAYLAVEGGYTYLGEYAFAGQVIADPGTVSANLQADDWNAFAVGILPLDERFDVFAKLGIGYWTADLATSEPSLGVRPKAQTPVGPTGSSAWAPDSTSPRGGASAPSGSASSMSAARRHPARRTSTSGR